MRNKKKNWLFLLISFFFFVFIYWLFAYSSPDENLSVGFLSFSTVPIFIIGIFLFFSFFFSFWLRNVRRGILIGLFASGYFILALLNISHVFFIFTLAALLIVIELFFSRR